MISIYLKFIRIFSFNCYLSLNSSKIEVNLDLKFSSCMFPNSQLFITSSDFLLPTSMSDHRASHIALVVKNPLAMQET